jgi:hypothetical protein
MDNWLGKVSRHPTSATIVGGLATAAIIAAVTHWWDAITFLALLAWFWVAEAFHGTGSWLWAPASIPHYVVIIWAVVTVLVFFGGFLFAARIGGDRFRAMQTPSSLKF